MSILTDDGPWAEPPTRPEIAPLDAHIWQIELDRDVREVGRLARLLSGDEVVRADRLSRGEVRDRFVVGRATLRRVLGLYLGIGPESVVFHYGPRGKPAVEGAGVGPPPQFNLAHSRGLALLALTRGRRVGIDVEEVRPMPEVERVVERFFSPRERGEFRSIPGPLRLAAFFRGWTRKEAFLKAIGEGLVMPLDHFDVSLSPAEPPELLAVAGSTGEAARWTLSDLDVRSWLPGRPGGRGARGAAPLLPRGFLSDRTRDGDETSFEPQGLDGAESRGPPGRVIAEDDPHRDGDGHRRDDGQGGRLRRPPGQRPDQE